MSLAAALVGQVYSAACEAGVEHHVTIDGNGPYSVVHTGINVSGVAATGNVYISAAGTITATDAAGAKFILKSGYAIDIPTEWRTMYFKTAAGAPVLSFLPKRGKTS